MGFNHFDCLYSQPSLGHHLDVKHLFTLAEMPAFDRFLCYGTLTMML